MDEYEEKFYTDEELVKILAGTKKNFR